MPLNWRVWSHLSHKERYWEKNTAVILDWECNQHGRQWLNLVWLAQNEVLEWPQGDVLLAWVLLLCIESDQHEILFQRWLERNLRKTDAFLNEINMRTTQKAFKTTLNFTPKLTADLSHAKCCISLHVNQDEAVRDRNTACYNMVLLSR